MTSASDLSKHSEAISRLKKDAEELFRLTCTFVSKQLFFWVLGIVIVICGSSIGALFVSQSQSRVDISAIIATSKQTQGGVERILNRMDAGQFVTKDALEEMVKKTVQRELYFFLREQKSVGK